MKHIDDSGWLCSWAQFLTCCIWRLLLSYVISPCVQLLFSWLTILDVSEMHSGILWMNVVNVVNFAGYWCTKLLMLIMLLTCCYIFLVMTDFMPFVSLARCLLLISYYATLSDGQSLVFFCFSRVKLNMQANKLQIGHSLWCVNGENDSLLTWPTVTVSCK